MLLIRAESVLYISLFFFTEFSVDTCSHGGICPTWAM